MTLGKNQSTGRFDASQSPIMKRIRKPRFVDNAVRHAEYSKKTTGFSATKPTATDFLPTHDRTYRLIEEEDTIRLLHNPSEAHEFTGPIYSDGVLPPLMVGSEDYNQSLAPSSIETATKGTRFRIENLKGKDLRGIGFADKTIRLAQKIGVGLRSSDLAIKVANSTRSSISGVVARTPSTTFIAHDFYGVDALGALRFISKHDGHLTKGDQYGNLHYSSQRQYNREHFVTENRVTGGTIIDQNESVPNRVIVRGKPRANNDMNVVQVDDFGPQKHSVNEIPGGIHVPTAITKSSARRIGQRVLSMAKRSTGSEKLTGVMAATHIHPGDAISYQTRTNSQRKVVLGAKYDLSERTTELHINSVESTLEDVIQRFQEVDISGSEGANYERNRQFTSEEFSTSFGFNIKVTWQMSVREDLNRGIGMVIGQMYRSDIHGKQRFRSTGVLIDNAGGYPVGTSVFTTSGLNPTLIFALGDEVYRSNGNKLGHVSARTPTSVTIGIASADLVKDNEELLILATSAYAEANNAHLKLGMNQGKYLKNRRG